MLEHKIKYDDNTVSHFQISNQDISALVKLLTRGFGSYRGGGASSKLAASTSSWT